MYGEWCSDLKRHHLAREAGANKPGELESSWSRITHRPAMIDGGLQTVVQEIVRRRAGVRAALVCIDTKPLRHQRGPGVRGDGRVPGFRRSAPLDRDGRQTAQRVRAPRGCRLSPAGAERRSVRATRPGDQTRSGRHNALPRARLSYRALAVAADWHGEAVLRAAAELHSARLACSPRWEYDRDLTKDAWRRNASARSEASSRPSALSGVSVQPLSRMAPCEPFAGVWPWRTRTIRVEAAVITAE